MKYFPHNIAVHGKVRNLPNGEFFFVENGDPRRKIRCDRSHGGDVGILGTHIVFIPDMDRETFPENVNLDVILIRKDQDPKSDDYTIAQMWAPLESWKDVEWWINRNTVYKATAYDHTINDEPSESGECQLTIGILSYIISMISTDEITGIKGDTHEANAFGNKYKSKIRWEKLVDGVWTLCECPLPPYLQNA